MRFIVGRRHRNGEERFMQRRIEIPTPFNVPISIQTSEKNWDMALPTDLPRHVCNSHIFFRWTKETPFGYSIVLVAIGAYLIWRHGPPSTSSMITMGSNGNLHTLYPVWFYISIFNFLINSDIIPLIIFSLVSLVFLKL